MIRIGKKRKKKSREKKDGGHDLHADAGVVGQEEVETAGSILGRQGVVWQAPFIYATLSVELTAHLTSGTSQPSLGNISHCANA